MSLSRVGTDLDALRAQVAELSQALSEQNRAMAAQRDELTQALRELEEQSRLLRAIAEGTAAETGDEFFPSLVTHLTATLKVKYAVVAALTERPGTVRTLAVSVGGQLMENFEYSLEHAPCGTGLREPFWCFEEAVQTRFPHFPELGALGVESHCGASLRTKDGRVVGMLIVMDTKPLRNSAALKSLMEVFASRAAAELQRHQAELAQQELARTLRASEDHLVTAQELAHVGSWEWDLDTGAVSWSDEQFRIFGHEPGAVAVTAETWLTALHPDDHDALLSALNDLLITHRPLDVECRILRPNGEVRILQARGEVRCDDRGRRVEGTVLDITEQKHTVMALQSSEERWHLAVEASHDGIRDWDLRTGAVFFSARWKAMRGFRDEDISDSVDEWRSRIHPDDLDRVLEHMDQYLTRQRPDFWEEYRVQRQDGSYVWVLDRAVAVWDADGRPTRLVGSESDITVRKEAEQALRDSEARTRSILDTAMDAVVSLDPQGCVTTWNGQAERMFGYRAEEAVGRRLSDLIIPPRHRAAHEAGLASALQQAGRQPVKRRIQLSALHRDGHEIPVEFVITVTADEGAPVITGFIRDITEEKRAAEALHRTAETLRAVVQSAPLAIVTADAQGRVTGWNPAAERIFGLPERDMLGQPLGLALTGRQDDHQMLLSRLSEQGDPPGMEFQRERNDGSRVDVRLWSATLLDAAGRTMGSLAILADVTEQKRDAEALARHERQLRTVLEALPIGVWFTDAQGTVLLANPAARALWSQAKHIGMGTGKADERWWDRVGPAAEPHRWMLSEVLTKGTVPADDTLEIACGDGSLRTVRNSAVPVYGEGRSIQGAVLLNEDITDRMRAEQERARTQALLESVIENIPHLITVKDAENLRFVLVNRAAEEFFGRPRKDLIGASVFDLLAEEEATEIFATDLRVLARRKGVDIADYVLRSAAGERRVLRTKKLPTYPRRDIPQHVLSISEDITEQAEAERAEQHRVMQLIRFQSAQLRFSKSVHADLDEDLRLIAEATADALNVERTSVWLFDDHRHALISRVVYSASRQRHEAADMKLEAARFPAYFDALESALVIAADDAHTDPRTAELSEYLRTLGLGSMLNVPIRRRGQVVGVLCHEHAGGARIWGPEEEAFGISSAEHVALSLAAADRRSMEAALRASEERFSKAFRASPHPVVIADLQTGSVIEANDAAYQLFQYDGAGCAEGLHALEAALWPAAADRDRFIAMLQRQGSVSNHHVVLRTRSGEPRQCLLSSELIDVNGRRCMVIVGTDVTEQARAEEALRHREQDLRHAIEERERISQDLHDGILQSLYAVGLGLESCKPLIKQRKQLDACAMMERAISQLNHVMADVRNFIAGLESEVLHGSDFETALRTAVDAVIQAHPIECRLHIEQGALPCVPLDRGLQLINILREGVSNIVRHARATQLSVSLRRLRRTVRLRIHDNGIGFDIKAAAGTGHGLVNMSARARRMGAEFELHSAPGEGTTIIVDLPKEEEYAHAEHETDSPAPRR